jgi:hypothetical protein
MAKQQLDLLLGDKKGKQQKPPNRFPQIPRIVD